FLVENKRLDEAKTLAKQLEPLRSNLEIVATVEFAEWAKVNSAIGNHKAAIQWYTRAIQMPGEHRQDLLRLRAQEHKAVGNMLAAMSDETQAKNLPARQAHAN